MPYARVPTDPAGAPANTVRACVGDQIYRPARFPGDVGGAVHHMRAVVRIPQTMADRSGHLAARSARTWARLRVWNSCPNRCSSRSWRQTPRLPAKSCGPTSMTSPAGTTAGRRRMKRSTLHCARTPAPTWRLRPACSSLPVSVTRSWLRGAPFAAGEGRRSEAALRGSCSPRPWARHPPYGRVGTHRSRARPVSTAPGHPPRPRRIPPAVCGPRLHEGASFQRRPVRRALVGKAAGAAPRAPRMPIGLRLSFSLGATQLSRARPMSPCCIRRRRCNGCRMSGSRS
jgi:hypothetical protein